MPIALQSFIRYNVHYTQTLVFSGRTLKNVPHKEIKEKYYLVREDILPEAVLKTVQAKELLAHGSVKTIHDAVDQVGLSRSAFYKYKDGIFPLSKLDRERIITI